MRIDKEQVRQSYNSIAHRYNLERESFNNSNLLELFISLFGSGLVILDLGCGSGNPIDTRLAEAGNKIIGIDISDKQIELAKKHLPGHDFYRRNLEELNENEFLVDAIVSFYAIYHIDRSQHGELFRKMFSYLKPGGAILLTLSAKKWEGEKPDFYGERMLWSQNSSEENTELIKKAGFRIIFNENDFAGEERHQAIIAVKDYVDNNVY